MIFFSTDVVMELLKRSNVQSVVVKDVSCNLDVVWSLVCICSGNKYKYPFPLFGCSLLRCHDSHSLSSSWYQCYFAMFDESILTLVVMDSCGGRGYSIALGILIWINQYGKQLTCGYEGLIGQSFSVKCCSTAPPHGAST